MSVYTKTLILHSDNLKRPTYHEITAEVKAAFAQSGIQNGICVVTTSHTTCSVIFEEMVHDRNVYGDEFLQVDLNNILERIVPVCTTEGQYNYPGPLHQQFAYDCGGTPVDCLNAHAHIKASIFGASETLAILNGELMLGEYGYLYFVDWDHQRVRDRKCFIQIIGD
jgi:thiamine phosphate synthase YjbQ (UPF0047 family)